MPMDPIRKIGGICQQHALFFHVDAAHAGNATILDEFRYLIDGLELADSYVFNPHKWMFTNFDCSLFYTSDQSTLVRTFEIMPEYLKTDSDSAVNNYRDWGIQLGRRFRGAQAVVCTSQLWPGRHQATLSASYSIGTRTIGEVGE
jgi:aromatic-L-amino-acid decarboxylase